MRQAHIVTLAAAAIVGTVAGTTVALNAGGRTPADAPEAGSSVSSRPTPTTPADTRPLWTTPTSIHDGDKVLDVVGLADVDLVWRLPEGYLVTQATAPGQPAVGIYRVSADGLAELVTFILGRGDVDPSGQLFVGLDTETLTYQVREIATGKRVRTVGEGSTPGRAAAFSPDAVVTQWRDPDQKAPYLVRTNEQGVSTQIRGTVSSWNATPADDLLAGNSPNPNKRADSLVCLSTGSLTDPEDRTQNCDLAVYADRAVLDPAGARVLAVPALTDGFGPAKFVAVEIATGKVAGEFELPPLSLDGAFLDEDTVMVRAAINDAGLGTVIYRCTVDSACDEIERTEANGQLGITG